MGYLENPFVPEEKDSWPGQCEGLSPNPNDFLATVYVPTPKMLHLLISLPLWPASAILTCFRKLEDSQVDQQSRDEKLARNPTLLIHGTRDWFTFRILIRAWKFIKFPDSEDRLSIFPLEKAGHNFAENRKAVGNMQWAINMWTTLVIRAEDEDENPQFKALR
ncbi:MAG: hypothetical protein Q9207_007333 [Kuettlingeria erythrocarpa]